MEREGNAIPIFTFKHAHTRTHTIKTLQPELLLGSQLMTDGYRNVMKLSHRFLCESLPGKKFTLRSWTSNDVLQN